jgi:molybdopterin converting factor small subunit
MRDEHGKLRAHLSLFVNEEDSRFLGGEDATLHDGDIVHVIPALSGG